MLKQLFFSDSHNIQSKESFCNCDNCTRDKHYKKQHDGVLVSKNIKNQTSTKYFIDNGQYSNYKNNGQFYPKKQYSTQKYFTQRRNIEKQTFKTLESKDW